MDWQQTACILCECNCGIEVRIGGADGRRLERIRGDKAHPASRGYTCEKALRLDHYQNGRGERVLHPLRRRPDGTFEAVSWERAVTEIAARLNAVREAHGGETILYYGGGGQGNHLGGAYGNALFRGLGGRFRSTAIAQEKTGEIWVNGRMFGTGVRGDFAHCEVALFIGKNPWHTHGIPHARSTLKAIANDPGRAMVVIDPRRTETAQLAEHHLAVRPGRDAWLIAAMAATIVDEHLADTAWLAAHTTGADAVLAALRAIPIGRYCEIAGVPETDVRAAARRIARASSVAVFEDLGVQMNRHSTLVSYLEKLLWLLTGNLGRPGAQYAFSTLIPLAKASRAELGADGPRSPVVGARIVAGLLPCNVMAEEILADHPARYRALIVESGNPLHSVADSGQFRRAMAALELSVVIDVFLTETARAADYVLPALTQYEKFEATLFNFEFPRNVFHLRRPVLAPPDTPDGPLAEPEIHCRIAEAAGLYGEAELAPLRAAAADGRGAFLAALQSLLGERPQLGAVAPLLAYRALGPHLQTPDGTNAAAAAALLLALPKAVALNAEGVRRAGFGEGVAAADALFDAILASPSGVVFTDDTDDATWQRLATADGRVELQLDDLLAELAALEHEEPPGPTDDWPLLLSAGERRAFTANTIMRDPGWRRSDPDGALRLSPADAERFGVQDGQRALIETKRATAEVTVQVDPAMQPGHAALPNGFGLDHPEDDRRVRTGVAPNELTAAEDRDPWVGTPWHKSVPARLSAARSEASASTG
ncbi:MAG: molybdopterin-dependent oxidoreductase [Acidimicrobiales bacterium]